MISAAFGLATLLALLATYATRDAPDRRVFAWWLAVFWAFEEAVGRTVGWDATWVIAPAFDAGAGVVMLMAWVLWPARSRWRALVVLIFWAKCVAHLTYRSDLSPDSDLTNQYRLVVNVLYACLLAVVSGASLVHAIRGRPRHSRAVMRSVPARRGAGVALEQKT